MKIVLSVLLLMMTFVPTYFAVAQDDGDGGYEPPTQEYQPPVDEQQQSYPEETMPSEPAAESYPDEY